MKLIHKIILILFFYVNTYANEILVISIPKCGTHLLTRCVELLTNTKTVYIKELQARSNTQLLENEFLNRHLYYNEKNERELFEKKYTTFFIYRDPRDQIVSRAYWILKRSEQHPFCNYQKECSLSLEEIIDKLIKNVDKFYGKYIPWITSKAVTSVKFEDLIGPEGKGDLKLQKEAISLIANKLNIKSKQIEDYCLKNLFGGTGTFRKGEIGDWKKHFTKKQIRKFKKVAGDLLIKLGYEKDLNW